MAPGESYRPIEGTAQPPLRQPSIVPQAAAIEPGRAEMKPQKPRRELLRAEPLPAPPPFGSNSARNRCRNVD